MGKHEGWAGLLPNGVLPGEAASVVRRLDKERWLKAEERTAELIACIQPNAPSIKHRNAVADYVQRLIKKCFPCEVYTFGSVPLKTYLTDGDINLTTFSKNQILKDSWALQVRDMLENEEKNENAKFCVKEVLYIQAEVKIIKCLVENIVVEISFNQLGGLSTLCFLEEVDHLINQNHLFKRSIILIKAWCYYESRILGAHHGLISTYALETLVLYIFNVFNNSFAGPLEVLYRFLEFYSKFDWDCYCVSLWGPVRISYLPDIIAEPPRKDGGELLLSKLFLDVCSSVHALTPGGQENQWQPFVSKHFNVIDPLLVNNNLGCSVSKGNFFKIRSAFKFGAKRLARLLDCPKEDLFSEVNQFFKDTWVRHGSGHCPDAPRNDLRLANPDNIPTVSDREIPEGSNETTGEVSNREIPEGSNETTGEVSNREIPEGSNGTTAEGSNGTTGEVSNIEIPEGNNEAAVLGENYGRRPAADECLVQAHPDEAVEEVQNIIRWHGKRGQDPVYLAMDPCICSLDELPLLCSETSQAHLELKNIWPDINSGKASDHPSPLLKKLMRDIVSGLVHLHGLGTIHGDLKPQNVMIIKERSLCAKLSGIGNSKHLPGDMFSLSHHATGCSGSGWKAPEQLCQGRQTDAVDMFSLGCVIFFCMTGGKHPFGDQRERDENILNNKMDIFLVDRIPEAVHLIPRLLNADPDQRPKSLEVLQHPLFWSFETRLSFLCDTSNEIDDIEVGSDILKELEIIGPRVFDRKWDEKMGRAFINDIKQHRDYKYNSVRDLLRAIRNTFNHYGQLSEIQKLIRPYPGGFDEGVDDYFTRRFPKLLIEVYNFVCDFSRKKQRLEKYFKTNF